MSGTLNKVMLIGHLGDEVKMHYFDGGNCIGRFPIATNESYKRLHLERGGRKPETVFVVRNGPSQRRMNIALPSQRLRAMGNSTT